ncbi:hypothetical protein V1478_007039 [Vespula squamosa]|uniref:Uncharacterized protein n=1 Tax=Vespula squamosa TaxID=30214 RepID=A0ABD2B218_VESSQ
MGNLTMKFFRFTSANLFRTICPCFQRNGEPNTAIIASIITPRISLQVGIRAERDFSLMLFSQPSFISRHRPKASKPMITPRRNILINYITNLQTTLVSAMELFRETNWKQTTRLADMINRIKSLKDITIHRCPKYLYKKNIESYRWNINQSFPNFYGAKGTLKTFVFRDTLLINSPNEHCCEVFFCVKLYYQE